MPIETRWMRNETHTINGLLCYKLWLSKITTERVLSRTITQYTTAVPVGIRVWYRTTAGVETEITAGTPVAQVVFTVGDVDVTYSNTWSCPSTTMLCANNIVVRVYMRVGTTWYLVTTAVFSTEQLNAQNINASIWTVYYTGDCSATISPPRTSFALRIDGDNNTRIENFDWTPCALVKEPLGDGLVFWE